MALSRRACLCGTWTHAYSILTRIPLFPLGWTHVDLVLTRIPTDVDTIVDLDVTLYAHLLRPVVDSLGLLRPLDAHPLGSAHPFSWPQTFRFLALGSTFSWVQTSHSLGSRRSVSWHLTTLVVQHLDMCIFSPSRRFVFVHLTRCFFFLFVRSTSQFPP
ncbi:hypothetical protein EDB80DRAFT_454403 [Ilyonectria destructans]|nr:hypothetical protein EDB80DRAFT_454403 [Ilyonectria destructans]